MTTHERVMTFIGLLRGSPAIVGMDPNDTSEHIITEVFTQGNCGNFAMALQVAFGGDLWKSATHHHILCKIDDRLYDITGDVTDVHQIGEVVTAKFVVDKDYIDNYSFDARGPMI